MSVRKHVLTITPGADHPQWQCPGPDHCVGSVDCDQPHDVPGWGTADDPYDAPEGAPWEGYDEFEFHGVEHKWVEWHGWTVPYPGCVVAANDAICDDAHDIALDHGCGRHEVDDDWDDMDCSLIHVKALGGVS